LIDEEHPLTAVHARQRGVFEASVPTQSDSIYCPGGHEHGLHSAEFLRLPLGQSLLIYSPAGQKQEIQEEFVRASK